ncbi:MAG: Stk1 family PASTA domain-containing Ser/Thr kinase [Oscillospiraceae bacterium]|nr:Stk1 family PASTA domain-containing Ser/Thr kinase [Oscillospiraceae bacterium]
MDQYIGKMLDNRYEILEHIGTGGMAVVYKARCHRLNRLVAIKILKPELATDEEFLRRFHAESQAVAMLSHVNIVSIFDVCHSDGLDYIVMELIDGMTLKQYMQRRGTPLNWREALHFITQVVAALGHAHSRGIIHRDITPHNIMVLRDGSVKVADFGIARLTSAVQSTLTQEALGSVHYISPEQAKGSHIDGRSDLYSAGVMLYEMLTGRLPFEGETPVFVAIQHINSIPLAPRELNPSIPEALEAITMKAMAPNPDQRYPSAEAMLEDLREFRKNPGVVIQKPAAGDPDHVEEPTVVISAGEVHAALEHDAAEQPTMKVPSGEIRQAAAHGASRRNGERINRGSEEKAPRRKRFGVPPVLYSILAVLVVVGLAAVFIYNTLIKDLLSPVKEYTVPDLRGYTVEELTNDPAILGDFSWNVVGTISDSNFDEGQICKQSPVANSIIRDPKATISVTISAGEDSMYMPDVGGWEGRKALNKLQNEMGLYVSQEEREYSDTVPKGYVISYSPLEGTLLKKGDRVSIVISKGPAETPVNVFSFIDVNIEQVRSQVESLGLTMGKVDEFYSDEYEAGRVIWQSINPETEVDPGTVINFQVSKGPEPKPDPDPSGDPTVPGGDPEDPSSTAEPSQPGDAVATTKTIQVDLSPYENDINIRIMSGDTVLCNETVDGAMNHVFTYDITGTGTQRITVYINDVLTDSYVLQF